MTLKVKYFSSLRDHAHKDEDQLPFKEQSASDLYRELQQKYHFPLEESFLKVAINETYQDWDTPLKSGDTVAFIPPVAGG